MNEETEVLAEEASELDAVEAEREAYEDAEESEDEEG